MHPSLRLRRLVFSAMCLALALILPFLTGQLPQIGAALSPMHIPALLCGFLCGPIDGALVGAVAPLLRNLLFSMPPLATAIPMSFELAAYGLTAALLSRMLPKKLPFFYLSLLGAMLAGRLVWGLAKLVLSLTSHQSFPLSAFLAGAITGGIPGILVQLLLLPPLLAAIQKAGFFLDSPPKS